MRTILIAIVFTSLLSWTVLPLVIPPFGTYSFGELLEVLMWQGIGTVGWPIALLFGIANTLLQRSLAYLGTLIIVLIYPSMLYLLIRAWRVKRLRWWELVLLNTLIICSFAAVWYRVLNGYDFMTG